MTQTTAKSSRSSHRQQAPCLWNSYLTLKRENERLSLSLRIREFQMEQQRKIRELFGVT